MRSLILSQTSLIQSQRGHSPMATQPLGSTIGETSIGESGVLLLVHQLISDQISHLGYATRGVKLSSNGLSSSGRCSDRESLGTSDPQEPLKTCELQCHHFRYLITLPVSDLSWMLSLWEDEGCTLPSESPEILKFYTCTCLLTQLWLVNSN